MAKSLLRENEVMSGGAQRMYAGRAESDLCRGASACDVRQATVSIQFLLLRVQIADDRPRAVIIRTLTAFPATRVPDDQDYLLLHRMADGDESALAPLYDRWSRRVYTIAVWILKDPDDAEDVVEETFWQVWRTAGQFDRARASVATWLTMIARSRALDRLRGQRRRIERTAQAASKLKEDWEGAYGNVPADTNSESSSRLAAALNTLPPEQREALQLAFFSGLSHSEIAAQTAQPLGTIKTRIRTAMEKLRQALGQQGNRVG